MELDLGCRGSRGTTSVATRSSYDMSAPYTFLQVLVRCSRVEDPAFHVAHALVCLVRGLVPVALDLAEQAVLVLLSTLLCLLALGAQVVLELIRVPVIVWLGDIVLPVLLDQVLQIFTVGCGRERNVVVRQPSLKLGLVPFVVSCAALRQ